MVAATLPLIFNPRAGRGAAARRIDEVVAKFAAADIDVQVMSSTSAGDIETRVRDLGQAGEPRILLAGGDGSVHEAVNGLLACNPRPAVGLIPLGTGNDFAKANRIPLRFANAVAELVQRLRAETVPRAVDIGLCNDRYFANGVGIGFDAKVSRIAADLRWPLGQLVYPLALLRGLAGGVMTPRIELAFDDERVDAPLTLASFNIGQWVGGMFRIAPGARNDDGKLDLVYVDGLSRLQAARLAPKLLDGTHLKEPAVHHRLVRACRVRAAAELPAHLDGENQPLQQDFNIRVLPAAIKLL